jgi:hypothetical protein
MTDNEEITEERAEEILRGFAEQKQNQHSFFTNVIKADSTTRVGNLGTSELGIPKLPQRTLKELELICTEIGDDETWGKMFGDMAEIQTSTSLSKEGFLMKLSVTSTKQLADISPKEKKANKGWFAKKDKGGAE